MKYCVLLSAMDNEAKAMPFPEDADMLEIAYSLIACDTIQLVPVYPGRLPKGYEAVCDENRLDTEIQIFNPLASWLYGCDDHGVPITKNVVIFKVKRDSFVLMSEPEARKICDDLNARADEIFDLTMFATMGIRK